MRAVAGQFAGECGAQGVPCNEVCCRHRILLSGQQSRLSAPCLEELRDVESHVSGATDVRVEALNEAKSPASSSGFRMPTWRDRIRPRASISTEVGVPATS